MAQGQRRRGRRVQGGGGRADDQRRSAVAWRCVCGSDVGRRRLLHFLARLEAQSGTGRNTPACFADTGVQSALRAGGSDGRGQGSCKVRLVGGAETADREQADRWAKRNLLAVRSVLWRSGVFLDGEEVGGTKARRATLTVSNGEVLVGLHE